MRKPYYFTTAKFIRDLVHGYIYLTKFELTLIDTLHFQRLKDIRQLTCQHVYPARHTRFDHSLGVLSLTRRAIKNLNTNGYIDPTSNGDDPIISPALELNALIAALLHDVGHCPFSHMGEVEMDREEVRRELLGILNDRGGEALAGAALINAFSTYGAKVGAIHEQLSCLVILKHYYPALQGVEEASPDLKIDFELILRCILGLEYDVSTVALQQENAIKNLLVNLINSKAFDMDKLDYIMRDSLYTGIGAPQIDTKRLFRNIRISPEHKLVFTSKAVPSLQSLIEARDNLYMWVYNHHAVVYSDFIYSYIFRRLTSNAEANEAERPEEEIAMGIVPKRCIFSVASIVDYGYSDSDLQAILFAQQRFAMGAGSADTPPNIERALVMVENLLRRKFLKPWWKTVFEFNNFMNRHFIDDLLKKKIGQYICTGGEYGLDSAEFRSQIAKHVLYLTKQLHGIGKLSAHLEDGDFFIVQRSNRFFELETIEKFIVYLKKNEVVGTPTEVVDETETHFGKILTSLLPQKDYSSMFAKEGFYLYVLRYEDNPTAPKTPEANDKAAYYDMIEKVFVFAATELAKLGEQQFMETFQTEESNANKKANEQGSNDALWEKLRKGLQP